MKWFTKQKRHYAALSTLVALALASSTAFAMPTGGTVTSGSLDGYSGGDLTSGASLIPTKDSIINWDSFRSELDFYGGTIEVADDVTFTEYGASPSISLMAMQSIIYLWHAYADGYETGYPGESQWCYRWRNGRHQHAEYDILNLGT